LNGAGASTGVAVGGKKKIPFPGALTGAGQGMEVEDAELGAPEAL